ncbi:MAG: nucleotidyl transferase AbiEii/AbiGii toxin family protein [Gemmataceae bacterium]
MAKHFTSAPAFKASLEAHLRKRADKRGVPLSTQQLRFAIERLLARLFRDAAPGWLLKGGFSLDLRFRPLARTTKDIDLAVALDARKRPVAMREVRDRLQEAAQADLGDFLAYRIAEPKRELTNAPGGGGRFPCEAVLVGKAYAKFHIDVGFGDATIGEPEPLMGDDLLDFAGIAPARVFAIPKSQQFAEKAHAYTFPWGGRRNTRTKDLVDLVLLIERGDLDAESVRPAVVATFEARRTHTLPLDLAPPPPEWQAEFASMAAEAGLTPPDYLAAFDVFRRFWSAHRLGDNPST